MIIKLGLKNLKRNILMNTLTILQMTVIIIFNFKLINYLESLPEGKIDSPTLLYRIISLCVL